MRVIVTVLLLLAACEPAPPAKDLPADTHSGGGGGGDDSACEPAASIAADREAGGIPLTVTLTGAVSCGLDGWTASWDFGDGESGTGEEVEHTWLASGSYTVALTMTDETGAALAAETTITVREAECPGLEEPVQVGTVADPELVEASGLAEGLRNPGVLWSHNDSGDSPRLFALDPDGTARGTFTLEGAPEGDWEDLAIGEEADGTAVLFAGDIGNNGGARETLTVYVVPEPPVGETAEALSVTSWWSFDLAFPDSAALDSAGLLWDPVTGDLYLASEEGGTTGIYRAAAPFSEGTTVELERVAGLTFGAGDLPGAAVVSGGAMSPLGDRMVLRTSDSAYLWRRDQAATIEEAWAGEPCPLAMAEEVRGEAVAFSADGAGYYTTSEEAGQPIWYTAFVPECTAPEIVVTADSLQIPAEPTFSIDETCVPAGVASVSWSFGDGETSTEDAPAHLYLASGEYVVTADVLDGDGEASTVTTTIEVLFPDCPTPGATETWGTVTDEDIVEASGLGQSRLNPGVLWTHNDSSDVGRLFAISEAGGSLGEFTVETDNRDWEDLALGWDETLGGYAIYVGDFGDNGESRDDVTVLVVPEPEIDIADVPIEAEITGFVTLTLLYPDEAHNAESLLVDPVTGDLYVVTKDYGGDTHVFRKPAPHEDGTTTTLEHVADLVFGEDPLSGSPATTAGDFSPLGDRIAIRTYDHAWMWRRDQAATIAEAFATDPCDLAAPSEPQGEALAFTTDSAGYLTLSEGESQPIYYTPLE